MILPKRNEIDIHRQKRKQQKDPLNEKQIERERERGRLKGRKQNISQF